MTRPRPPLIRDLPLFSVFPNADQARKVFDPEEMDGLAASIKSHGLAQPITVRPLPGVTDAWQIVMGERRWRAHVILAERGELPGCTIRAIIERMNDRRRDIAMTLENLQRVDITPMEEARNYQRIIDGGMSRQELARELGLKPYKIQDRLQLLELAPEHVTLFEGGALTADEAYHVARLSPADQTRLMKMIGRGQVSGYKPIKAAVNAMLDGHKQTDFFGPQKQASESEVATLTAMEQKIERVAAMVAAGFKDNEVVVARKVSPDRARTMAERLALIRKHCLAMEHQLRIAAAQGQLAIAD
jgi:ParB/RepB/Spo0J family partition protein